jgi:hypothetical protein
MTMNVLQKGVLSDVARHTCCVKRRTFADSVMCVTVLSQSVDSHAAKVTRKMGIRHACECRIPVAAASGDPSPIILAAQAKCQSLKISCRKNCTELNRKLDAVVSRPKMRSGSSAYVWASILAKL